MDNAKTGLLIAQERKEHGLTQKNLSEMIGVSNATISKWETGKGFPDISMLEPLSKALDISISEILAGEKIQDTDITDSLINELIDASIEEQHRRKRLYNWIIAISVAIMYLLVSLITQKWEITWLIWLVYCFYRVITEYVLHK